jgi:hypothetical protein
MLTGEVDVVSVQVKGQSGCAATVLGCVRTVASEADYGVEVGAMASE